MKLIFSWVEPHINNNRRKGKAALMWKVEENILMPKHDLITMNSLVMTLTSRVKLVVVSSMKPSF